MLKTVIRRHLTCSPLVKYYKPQRAFTIIEMMLVVTLLCALTFIMSPSLSAFYNKAKLSSQINLLNSHLRLAKVTAATQFAYVVFCPSKNRVTCSNNWQDEIINFVDNNNNGVVDHSDNIFAIYKVPSSMRLSVNRTRLKFSPINSAMTTAATVALCQSKNLKKALVISNVGRIRLENKLEKIKCE